MNESAVDIVIGRVSPLRLGDPGPNAEALDRVTAAGLRAPDHGMLRPWRFLVIEGEGRVKFGELLAESLRRRDPGVSAEALGMERAKALRAPVIIVAATTLKGTGKVPAVEQVVSTGAAIQNMLIVAHALGYGGFWRTGAPAYDPVLIQALGLGDSDQIIGFIYLGTIVTPGKVKAAYPAGVVERWPGAASASA